MFSYLRQLMILRIVAISRCKTQACDDPFADSFVAKVVSTPAKLIEVLTEKFSVKTGTIWKRFS